MPAASMPGTSTSGRRSPPIPLASMRMTAATSGESKIRLSAAKVPEAPITADTSGGRSLGISRTASRPNPPPKAISGASGPSTTPNPIVATAASMTPGSSTG